MASSTLWYEVSGSAFGLPSTLYCKVDGQAKGDKGRVKFLSCSLAEVRFLTAPGGYALRWLLLKAWYSAGIHTAHGR